LKNIRVNLRPIVNYINLPTVLKTAVVPGESIERLFIATQVGEVFIIKEGMLEKFLDISSQVINLGSLNSGYDERGLLGLAFHPYFSSNGLFYLHYTLAGSQGSGALNSYLPNPCDIKSLNLTWINRETQFDHIDTVEEWIYVDNNKQPQKRRTLLNLRRPFANHNGVNSLNFSRENKKLVLTTGDGGSGYDPFNLAQNDIEIPGKIIEIDIDKYPFIDNISVVSRFNELAISIQECLTVITKGVRNIPGISYQETYNNQFIKYVGSVGQDLVESVYSFIDYKPVSVTSIVQGYLNNTKIDQNGIINLGWRGWEGSLPTLIIKSCSSNQNLDEKILPFYSETIDLLKYRLAPLIAYYHQEQRPDKFAGQALTAVKVYMGTQIPELTGSVIFSDWLRKDDDKNQGMLAYTRFRSDCKLNDYGIIETNNSFSSKPNYYVSMGTTLDQSRIFLGVYGSANVTDYNQGAIYEIIPI